MVEALGGGVSNIVLMVTTPAQCMVLKQALPGVAGRGVLAVARRPRLAGGRGVAYRGGAPAGHGTVPEVFFIDEENFIYGMSCAPAGGNACGKRTCSPETVDVPVAAAAGRLLAQMHAIQEPAVQAAVHR